MFVAPAACAAAPANPAKKAIDQGPAFQTPTRRKILKSIGLSPLMPDGNATQTVSVRRLLDNPDRELQQASRPHRSRRRSSRALPPVEAQQCGAEMESSSSSSFFAPKAHRQPTAGADVTPGASAGASTEQSAHRPRTFSKQCIQVMSDQAAVKHFTAQEIYRACAFFRECSAAFIRALVATGDPSIVQGTSFEPGKVVYTEGDFGSSMFVVGRGTAEMVRARSPKQTRLLHRGDHFGEANILGVLSSRQGTVRAKTSLHLLEVSGVALAHLMQRDWQGDDAVKEQADGKIYGGIANQSRKETQDGVKMNEDRVHTFAHERRFFEREAGRIYSSIKKGSTIEDGIADRDEDEPDGAGTVLANCSVPSNRQALSSPAPELDAFISSTANSATGVDNPKQWRLQIERATQDMMGGDKRREKFLQKLRQSIRFDVRQGYIMPPLGVDCINPVFVSGQPSPSQTLEAPSISLELPPSLPTSGSRRGFRKGAAEEDKVAQMPRAANMIPVLRATTLPLDTHALGSLRKAREKEMERLEEEEAYFNEESEDGSREPLALQLLPPMTLMGSRQKQVLMRHIMLQARTTKRPDLTGGSFRGGVQPDSSQGSSTARMVPSRRMQASSEISLPVLPGI